MSYSPVWVRGLVFLFFDESLYPSHPTFGTGARNHVQKSSVLSSPISEDWTKIGMVGRGPMIQKTPIVFCSTGSNAVLAHNKVDYDPSRPPLKCRRADGQGRRQARNQRSQWKLRSNRDNSFELNLAGIQVEQVTFHTAVTDAVGNIVKQTSEDPPKYLVRLLFSFRGINEVEVTADRIRGG